MKKNTKKFIAFIIILTLCCPIYAVSDTTETTELMATVQSIVMREYDGLDVAKFSEWLPLEDVS